MDVTRGRAKLPTRKAIQLHWNDWLWEKHNDPPHWNYCFACGLMDERWTLERAHIVARVNGGPDTAENLHLLCHLCHKASEYREGDRYWEWINSWTMNDRLILECAVSGEPIWQWMMDYGDWVKDEFYAKGYEDGQKANSWT